MNKGLKLVAVMGLGVLLTACGAEKAPKDGGANNANTNSEIQKNELEIPVERANKSVTAYLTDNKDLTLLDVAMRSSKLKKDLEEIDGMVTIFAPSNAAFGKVEEPRKLNTMMTKAEEIRPILESHVIGLAYGLGDFKDENVKTMSDVNVEIKAGARPMVNGITIVKAVQADNGFVYIIDEVIGLAEALGETEALEIDTTEDVETEEVEEKKN